jgi:hypothetical protein
VKWEQHFGREAGEFIQRALNQNLAEATARKTFL